MSSHGQRHHGEHGGAGEPAGAHAHEASGHSHGAHEASGHSHGAHEGGGHSHGAHEGGGHSHGAHEGGGHSHGAHEGGGHSHGAHNHGASEPPVRNAPLVGGGGRDKLLYFDAFSGMAGDMTLAALLDLGVPLGVVEQSLAALPVRGFSLRVGQTWRSGIRATTFDVAVETPQPERTYVEIDAMLVASALPEPTRALARTIFRRLGEAESDVHGIALEQVHFHEVGAVDAIVDIVGAAAAVSWLGAPVTIAPLPMGHGFVKARHGILPLPAPAAVGCLKGVPTYGVDVAAELVTPTGAAIASVIAQRFEGWPAFAPERVGWGAGTHDLGERPNLLRVVLGQPLPEMRAPAAHSSPTHVVLEANIDDMSGELAAHAIGVLMRSGALDAWVEPIVMKKGRPGLKLMALGGIEQADRLATVMLTETSTIGVRHTCVRRTERPRRTLEVATPYGRIPVKVSEGPFGPPQVKPEFDACVRAAEGASVPVREVLAAVLASARSAAQGQAE